MNARVADEAVVLTGSDLSIDDVVRVARGGARVLLDRRAARRIAEARAVVERALARGDRVYGTNTGVAAKKREGVASRAAARFNRLLVQSHRVGQGPLAAPEIVRGTLVRIANGFARGTTTATPELAERVVAALAESGAPLVRMLGSIGVSDLAPQADLADTVLAGYELRAGEALVFISNAGFSHALAALAVADASRLVAAMEAAGALELEAFAANLSILHPAVVRARPLPGHDASARRLRGLLAGSSLWEPGAARNLQDPLTYRGMPNLFGAARDALAYTRGVVEAELNAATENPLVAVKEGLVLSAWNGELAGLAAALDFLRIALAPVLTAACERLVKLLQAPLSGLPGGLAAPGAGAEDALAELGIAAQAITVEARLLAQPVSFDLASTTQAEGIEDRTTMTPLSARRLAEMVALGERLVAIELLVAAQAVDLRARSGAKRRPRLGRGTARLHGAVRALVPFTGRGDALPADLEPLRELVRSGRVG